MDAFTESAVSSDLGMMDGTTIKTIRCKAASSFFFFLLPTRIAGNIAPFFCFFIEEAHQDYTEQTAIGEIIPTSIQIHPKAEKT